MLTHYAALELAKLFRFFDATCREDLATRRIISERDYVSNLATHVRYPYGAFCSDRLRHYSHLLTNVRPGPGPRPRFLSVTSAPNIEQAYGCDGIIIFSFDLGARGILHRVGMYEAKWPRLHERTAAILNGWDDIGWRPTSRKRKPMPPYIFKSRFTNELLLQRPLAHAGIVVWEQYFCQLAVPQRTAEFRRYGSTCVLHEQALAYLDAHADLMPSPTVKAPKPRAAHPGHRAWDGTDLSYLLQHNSLSFGYLIYLLLRPNQYGRYLRASNNYITVPVSAGRPPAAPAGSPPPARSRTPTADTSGQLAIPAFTSEGAAADNPQAITRFMRESPSDLHLWDTMDEATFQVLEKMLSPLGADHVEYWHGKDQQMGDWRPVRPAQSQIRVPALVHEASTLHLGDDETAPVGLDYRPKGIENVYVTGAALWPTGASWNPTMTMVGLTQHLADELSRQPDREDTGVSGTLEQVAPAWVLG